MPQWEHKARHCISKQETSREANASMMGERPRGVSSGAVLLWKETGAPRASDQMLRSVARSRLKLKGDSLWQLLVCGTVSPSPSSHRPQFIYSNSVSKPISEMKPSVSACMCLCKYVVCTCMNLFSINIFYLLSKKTTKATWICFADNAAKRRCA